MGRAVFLRELLANEKDITFDDLNGLTPLHCAVLSQDQATVELCEKYTNKEILSKINVEPIVSFAAINHNWDAVGFLRIKGYE